MDIIRSVKDMQQLIIDQKRKGKKIGFVPTMGFLHEGHEKLIQNARENNDIVVISIFVNPLQFGPNEDFERYPRDEEHDKLISENNHVDFLFIPTVEAMYPSELAIAMDLTKRVDVLCGRTREGHFSGVVTVLAKLFNIVLPDNVYFGMKDAQQIAVVDSLINDLNYPIQLNPVPTVRESDGLAKSSRNVYLQEQERKVAPSIFQALQFGQKMVIDGEKNPVIIVKEVENFILQQTTGKIDYVEILSYPELTPVQTINQQVILATAVHFKNARLIDNIVIDHTGLISKRI
ncbi:pantoate--beta-alanine ligase [Aquibacillus rhizosphaerae]|uniref:Pantothenate synthetase n=1 Tax=Aquibacillus rhizosphaerae TaxID=3051431 RepID=A0ABT7L4P2_9BACI|nr:pantoate--beta-alanine ligase [Aquibacillus sp. LR5S19]MDL4840828.1 pantoate--beta-alanine ligase [Aquibacillus sp. LR5S19]